MKGHKHERKPGVWSLAVDWGRDGNGKRRWKTATFHGGERGAQRELNRMLAERAAGTVFEPNKQTVAVFLRRWLSDCAKPNVAPKTYERYEEIVEKHLIPELGGHKLTKLNPQHIQAAYAAALTQGRRDGRGGLSAQTVVHHHRVLRAALNQAADWDLIPRNPADRVAPPKVEQKEQKALDEGQMLALFNAIHGTALYMPVVIAGMTALRRGEVLAARWQDVDLKAGVLTVRQSLQQVKGGRAGISFKTPKTRKSQRTVELPSLLVDALARHKGAQAERRLLLGAAYQNQDLICCWEDGRLMVPNQVTQTFGDVSKRLGLGIRFHDLRHSHASQLLKLGVPVHVVSARLGHVNPSVTLNIYGHILQGMGRSAVDTFDQAMERAQAG